MNNVTYLYLLGSTSRFFECILEVTTLGLKFIFTELKNLVSLKKRPATENVGFLGDHQHTFLSVCDGIELIAQGLGRR